MKNSYLYFRPAFHSGIKGKFYANLPFLATPVFIIFPVIFYF